MHSLTMLRWVGAALLLSASHCSSESICVGSSSLPMCQEEVQILSASPYQQLDGRLILPQDQDTKLELRIFGRVSDRRSSPYPLGLLAPSLNVRYALDDATYQHEDPAGGGLFTTTIGSTSPRVPAGRYWLVAGHHGTAQPPANPRAAAPEVLLTQRTLDYQAPVVLTLSNQTRFYYPELNQLGVVGNDVVGFGRGTDGALKPKQRLRQFSWKDVALVEDPVSAFWNNSWDPDVRVSFAADNVLLAQSTAVNTALSTCPLSATMPANCRALSPSTLPADSQTLAVSADGKWGAYAANDGALWSRDLGASGMWQALVPQKPPTAKQVLGVWLADVNGDGKTDVVGVWQDGQTMTARVFLGNGSAFAEDEKWSQAVAGIGPVALSAMAMGDVDGDGYADVVVARGLTVTVQQNLFGTFAPVWQSVLDAKQAGNKVSALAVGRVSGTDPKQNLDIVAATYTDYDAMGKCSLYLHVFRPQPPTVQ